MLIICPKCFTQYQILDKDISLKGKKCHCSACGCYFDQEEDVVELTPSQNEKSTLEKTMDIFDIPEKKEEKTFLDEPHEPISLSLFNDPIEETKEPKFSQDPFNFVPEEFKPVKSKKTTFVSLVVWLGIGFGICYAAYSQKDFLVQFMNQSIEKAFGSNEKNEADQKSEQVSKKIASVTPSDLGIQIDDKQPLNLETTEEKMELKKESIEVIPAVVPTPVVEEAKSDLTFSQEEISLQEKENESVLVEQASEENIQLESAPIIEKEIEQQVIQNLENQEVEMKVSSSEFAPKEALKVQNISYEIGVNEVGTSRLLIKGVIVNTSVYQGQLPLTKAVVYDYSDRVVARKRIYYLEKVIDGNSELAFEAQVVPAPESVSKIEVNFDE